MTYTGDDESHCVGTEPCPSCGSDDNLKRYSDGHAYCFTAGCDRYEPSTGNNMENEQPATRSKKRSNLSYIGEAKALPARSITDESCKLWKYYTGKNYNGVTVQAAHYIDPKTRELVAIKTRDKDKNFSGEGNMRTPPFYGQNLWPSKGKKLVITEGEIDAITISQLQHHKWPVVSLPSGCDGALKTMKRELEWLCGFEEIVLFFDMDEAGRSTALACAEFLPAGKVKIADLEGYKDANEAHVAGDGKKIMDAVWQAKEYRPDGIISGTDITLEFIKETVAKGYSTHMPILNEMMGDLREAELTLLTAGSGIGKSTNARELAYHLHREHGLTIGNIWLEEGLEKSAKGYVAIDRNIPLGKLRRNPELLTDDEWNESLERCIHQRMHFYNHFGSLDSDILINKMRFMRVALGCHFVILDHISIVTSGMESSSEGERKDIDRLMTKLRSLVQETGVGIVAIVHLKQPEGSPHEEGGRVTLSQLRGSGALKQLSDNVIALERNQQGEDKHKTQVRVLKCREFGDTGVADTMYYNPETGRLLPCEADNDNFQGQEDAYADVPF